MSDSEEEIAERQFKIALVGDPEVGKTSIATRYAAGELGPLQPARLLQNRDRIQHFIFLFNSTSPYELGFSTYLL